MLRRKPTAQRIPGGLRRPSDSYADSGRDSTIEQVQQIELQLQILPQKIEGSGWLRQPEASEVPALTEMQARRVFAPMQQATCDRDYGWYAAEMHAHQMFASDRIRG